MDFYYSTENDPLEKFLFPNEISALRGKNVFEENVCDLMRNNIYFNKYIGGAAFCPEEMSPTLNKILNRDFLSVNRKVGFNIKDWMLN